jgi:cystine transport system substrate-binding protein
MRPLAVSRRGLGLGLAAAFLAGGVAGAARAEGLLAAVKSRGTLLIGLEGTYPPFNYQDENGNLVGFEVDFADALCAKLGVKPEFKPTKWDGILAALDSGRIDVVINQVTVTPEREKKFDFSQPYTVSGIQIVVRKGDEGRINKPADLAGKRVGVGLGTSYEQWLRANVPTADVRTYDDDPTKYEDLRAGRIDAVLTDRLVAADFVKKSGGPFVGAGAPFTRQLQAIALRKDPEMLAALNAAIDSLRADGELEKISVKWFGLDVPK